MSIHETGRRHRVPTLRAAALLAALSVVAAGCGKKEPMVLPAPEVFVMPAVAQDVPVTMELIGQSKLELAAQTLPTTAMWWTVSEAMRHEPRSACGRGGPTVRATRRQPSSGRDGVLASRLLPLPNLRETVGQLPSSARV